MINLKTYHGNELLLLMMINLKISWKNIMGVKLLLLMTMVKLKTYCGSEIAHADDKFEEKKQGKYHGKTSLA